MNLGPAASADDGRVNEIRPLARAARRSIRGAVRQRAEAAIHGHLCSIVALWRSRTVAAYEAADGEPDLASTIERLHRRGTTVALPLVDGERMWFRSAVPGGERMIGQLGISVPTDGRDLEVSELDAVVVPLVAFTQQGQRCGRGRAYYDRTFGPVVAADSGAVLIGVGFEAQRFDDLPLRDHDVDLDMMVTEVGVRHFDQPRRPISLSDETAVL